MNEELGEVICAVCGLPITGKDYDDRHTGHEEHCPRYGEDIDEEPEDVACFCDVNYHAACCPDCKAVANA